MWWENLIFVLVGGIVGVIPILIERIINNAGKINIYAKFYYEEQACANMQDGSFVSPVLIEIVNCKNSDFIMRDLMLYAYYKGEKVISFDNANESRNNKTQETEQYGCSGNYSWIIQRKNILTVKCLFILHKNGNAKDYDELVLSYKDVSNKGHLLHLTNIEKSWYNQEYVVPKEWVKLK